MAKLEMVCKICKKTFYIFPSRKHAVFCSRECQMQNITGENNPNWKGGLVSLQCSACGIDIKKKKKDVLPEGRNFCSQKCARPYCGKIAGKKLRKRIIKNCKTCGIEIHIKKSHQDIEGSYCSVSCMAEGYKTELIGASNPHWKGGQVEKVCPACGKKFYVTPSISESRIYCTKSCAAMTRLINMNYPKSNAKGGTRQDIGIFVRSSWEANYARYLNWLVEQRQIKSWEYEPDVFLFDGITKGCRSYLPDFKVTNNDESVEYHEVKGWMDKQSQTKLRRMKKYHPDVKIILIDKPVYNGIAKSVSKMISCWE